MKAYKLGEFLKIPIYIHWSFLFILLFIGYYAFAHNMSVIEIAAFSLYILTLFFCVTLHEYGHALMARRYNIHTQDIIISPIGGIARLLGMPSNPTGELLIAIAGPLVNLAISFLIIIFLYVLGIGIVLPDTDSLTILTNPIGFIHLILVMNLVLFVFNLIPAYPMDGGRIFRALLSYKLTKLKATFIAYLVGRAIAIGFIIFAFINKIPSLFFIGIFIFLVSAKEYKQLKMRDL